jgi:hypothetical protein
MFSRQRTAIPDNGVSTVTHELLKQRFDRSEWNESLERGFPIEFAWKLQESNGHKRLIQFVVDLIRVVGLQLASKQ